MVVNGSFKTLGVYFNPMIDWKDQCEFVKSKIQVPINNLLRIDIKACQAHMHFNMYMLTNVFLVLHS